MEVTLPPEPSAPAQARRVVDDVARGEGDVAAQVALLVSELVTNSVRHGGLDARQRIQLSAQVTPRGVRVEVADPGRGFVPAPREPVPGEVAPEGGYGLSLVERMADRWGLESDDGTRVWFEIDTPG